MRKTAKISFFILACLIKTSLVFSAEYPTNGYSEGPAIIEMQFIPINSSEELLGTDYDYMPYNGGHTSLSDGYQSTLGSYDYFIHDYFTFQVGDIIHVDGTTSYTLVTPDYGVDPDLYGYLFMDLDNSGDFSVAGDLTDRALGTLYDAFYNLPIGNGEMVFLFLLLSYSGYLLYKNKKRSKVA